MSLAVSSDVFLGPLNLRVILALDVVFLPILLSSGCFLDQLVREIVLFPSGTPSPTPSPHSSPPPETEDEVLPPANNAEDGEDSQSREENERASSDDEQSVRGARENFEDADDEGDSHGDVDDPSSGPSAKRRRVVESDDVERSPSPSVSVPNDEVNSVVGDHGAHTEDNEHPLVVVEDVVVAESGNIAHADGVVSSELIENSVAVRPDSVGRIRSSAPIVVGDEGDNEIAPSRLPFMGERAPSVSVPVYEDVTDGMLS
jgi:hypothetical protein